MTKTLKLPRKLKKAFKKEILKSIDSAWRSKDIRIFETRKMHKDSFNRPHINMMYVTGYSLGW